MTISEISSQNLPFLLSSSTALCRMRGSECLYLFQTWLQSAKEEQSVAVAESQPTSSSPSLSSTDRLHQDAVWCHPSLAARLPCLWTKPFWRAAQLLLLSGRRSMQIYICFCIKMMCFTQWLLCTGQKESKALHISSKRELWPPLLVSTQKKSGFPDTRASRRNSCSKYSPAGTPQFWHIPEGKQKPGQIFKSEKKHQTLGSMIWDSVLRATWLCLFPPQTYSLRFHRNSIWID